MSEPRIPKTFRLPRSLVQELDVAAELGGVSRTSIVEGALRVRLGAVGEGFGVAASHVASAAATSAPPESSGEVDLPSWLAERTGRPRSLCRMFVAQGRVSLGGVKWQSPWVYADRLGMVELDGEAV